MKRIISKNVVALYSDPGRLLPEEYFRSIRERLFNKDRYTTDEESGIQKEKKITLKTPGMGSNERGGVLDGLGRDPNESHDRTMSSGYNDGERADDETGPGNTSITPNPYYGSDVLNDVMLDFDMKATDRDRGPAAKHLNSLLRGKPIRLPAQRYSVDRFN